MASRRAAEDLIREGRVRLNGKVISELGTKADPTRDKITVDGRAALPRKLAYVAYHKPAGIVSTMSDPEGRPAIGDVVRNLRARLFPVGRLDFESSGLVLLTNDGDLAQQLTHPRFQIPKVYRVKVRGRPEESAVERLRRGVRLEDGVTAPAEVVVESILPSKSRLRIILREGRQRQVRRMCEAVGHPVERLSRIAIGPLKLGALRVGETRDLTPREVLALRHAVSGHGDTGDAAAHAARPKRSARPLRPVSREGRAPSRTARANARSSRPRRD
ncbi:MAG: pseudouridine synthase [Candidatus Binatia bacterium]